MSLHEIELKSHTLIIQFWPGYFDFGFTTYSFLSIYVPVALTPILNAQKPPPEGR